MMRNESGQSLVEFALILPILVLLIMGVFDFGRMFYTYTHLHMTTQETVRLGGLGQEDAEIVEFAKNYFHAGDGNDLIIEISPQDTVRKSGEYMTVTLTYPFEYAMPFISNVLPSPYEMTTDSTIRVE